VRGRWWTPRAIGLHVTALVVVPGCLVATWWQADRALSGNALSYLYSFEWPFFAGYGVYLWWRLVHEQPAAEDADAGPAEATTATAEAATATTVATTAAATGEEAPGAVGEDEEAAALAAYNRYLAALNASGSSKRLVVRRRRAHGP
jgi:hypothetical protein